MAMQRFFEFFRRKNYGALWNNLFNFFHLRSSAVRVKFSQTYKKNNFFIWGRLFSSSSLTIFYTFLYTTIWEGGGQIFNFFGSLTNSVVARFSRKG